MFPNNLESGLDFPSPLNMPKGQNPQQDLALPSTRLELSAYICDCPQTAPSGSVQAFQEVDERNAKLLQTLSEATDMLAKADEMQACFATIEGFSAKNHLTKQKFVAPNSKKSLLCQHIWVVSCSLSRHYPAIEIGVQETELRKVKYTADIKEAREKAAQDSRDCG